jgi:hypothetical protein
MRHMLQNFLKPMTNNKISFSLFLLFGSLFLLFSCKKEADYLKNNQAGGPPSIERIRFTDPKTTDSSFKKATLGSTLAIVGTNLANAQTVSFNGYTVIVNPVYATNSTLIVAIPDSTPTIATNPNVKNEIRVKSPLGEAVYGFTILPPSPVVEQIGNEFAKQGESVTLYGKYFYFVDTVAFPGGVNVTTGITTTGTSLTVTMPAGVDVTKGDIRVKSQSGWSVANRATKFYDRATKPGMLLNWDEFNSNFGWGIDAGKKVLSAYAGITPIENKFGVIDMSIAGGYGWSNDKVIDIDNWGTGIIWPTTPAAIYDPNAAASNFDFKFEMASTQPIGELLLQLNQNGYSISVPLKTFVKSADGKWYTVSANLGELAKSGAKLGKLKDLTANQTFQMVISNPGAADLPATLAIDNIRIVRVLQ